MPNVHNFHIQFDIYSSGDLTGGDQSQRSNDPLTWAQKALMDLCRFP